MEFHLGMKRKFVFSAGGMFNVDFQLISGADEFYTVLYRIMKKDKTWGLLNNDGLRAHSLKRKSFSVNAAGFCQVDLKFFAGMISATVTYSVILLQMGKNF
ncbi:uncharacterized protein [Halyomorpha halys]|uniref:uncharacterized protein n=1 Tax=Halyomorpha halys TaxID=286706 RepID=UPI0006D4EA9D|nr:uncharacterized protein LOC106691917 [Halyomorpha halys]